MKVYRTDEIRNVVLLGHGGSGKTSLVEAMLYVSGATNRMGKIADHNTVSDFDKEEQKREFSISTSLVPIEWEKAKINVLDTPGYFDFVGEVEEAVSQADAENTITTIVSPELESTTELFASSEENIKEDNIKDYDKQIIVRRKSTASKYVKKKLYVSGISKVEIERPTIKLPTRPIFIPELLVADTKEEIDTKTIVALKSNVLYDVLSLVNYSIEVPFCGDKFSALYYHQFPWWRWGKANNEYCIRFLSIGCEGRWWFKPQPRLNSADRMWRDKLVGHFLGAYVESGKWDFEFGRNTCHQGEHWSAGLSYGFSMPVSKRLNLEFSLSVGYASIAYRKFAPSYNYEILWRDPEKHGRWSYFGPTKAQISLVMPFTVKKKKGGGR